VRPAGRRDTSAAGAGGVYRVMPAETYEQLRDINSSPCGVRLWDRFWDVEMAGGRR